MKKIALIYDSETGNTERIAHLIKLYLTDFEVDMIKVEGISISKIQEYQYLIFGTPTWRKGYLAVNWAGFFNDFSKINFIGKTVALFGVGDQENYSRTFLDGMGQLAEVLLKNKAKIVGNWSVKEYYFDDSLANLGNGYLVGLGLDETNQSEMTEQRVIDWTKQITIEFRNHGKTN
jgi:flavodoxin I